LIVLLIAALVVAVVAAVVAVVAVVVGLTEMMVVAVVAAAVAVVVDLMVMMVVAVGVAVVAVAAMAAVVYQPMYLLRLPDVSCELVADLGFAVADSADLDRISSTLHLAMFSVVD
jgi:hypothetical protein